MKTSRKIQRGIIAGVLILLTVIEGLFLVDNYQGTRRGLVMDAHRDFRLRLANEKDSLFKSGGIDLLLKKLSVTMDSSWGSLTRENDDKNESCFELKTENGVEHKVVQRESLALDTSMHKSIERWVNLEKIDSIVGKVSSAKTIRSIRLEAVNDDTLIEVDLAHSLKNLNLPSYWNKRNPNFFEIQPKVVLQAMIPQFIAAIFLWLLLATVLFYGYRSLEKSRRLLMLKDEFVANFSHELKTPVAAVKIALETISKQKDLSPQTIDYIIHSEAELVRLERLLEKVLDSTKMESGIQHLNISTINLRDFLVEIQAYFNPLAEQNGHKIKIAQNADLSFNSDIGLLTAVLNNIIENAIKYGSGSEISISTIVAKEQVQISVCNAGEQIPKEYQSQIFERYFRVPTGNVHNVKGHGLGLYFAKSICEQLGGKLEYTYSDSSNCFTLKLPLL